MRTWEDYKNHVKAQSLDEKENMERIEELNAIIGKMIIRRELADDHFLWGPARSGNVRCGGWRERPGSGC